MDSSSPHSFQSSFEIMAQLAHDAMAEFSKPFMEAMERASADQRFNFEEFLAGFITSADRLTNHCCHKFAEHIRYNSGDSPWVSTSSKALAKTLRNTNFDETDKILHQYVEDLRQLYLDADWRRQDLPRGGVDDGLLSGALTGRVLSGLDDDGDFLATAGAVLGGITNYSDKRRAETDADAILATSVELALSKVDEFLGAIAGAIQSLADDAATKCFGEEIDLKSLKAFTSEVSEKTEATAVYCQGVLCALRTSPDSYEEQQILEELAKERAKEEENAAQEAFPEGFANGWKDDEELLTETSSNDSSGDTRGRGVVFYILVLGVFLVLGAGTYLLNSNGWQLPSLGSRDHHRSNAAPSQSVTEPSSHTKESEDSSENADTSGAELPASLNREGVDNANRYEIHRNANTGTTEIVRQQESLKMDKVETSPNAGPQELTGVASDGVMTVDPRNDLEKVDREMNVLYRNIMRRYSDGPEKDLLLVRNIRQGQNEWIEFRDAHIESVYPSDRPHYSARGTCAAFLQAQLTRERISQLRGWWNGVEEGDVCAGTYRTVEIINGDEEVGSALKAQAAEDRETSAWGDHFVGADPSEFEGLANPVYSSYSNVRFAFAVDYPANVLFPQVEPDDGGGLRFISKNARFEMVVIGTWNAMERTIEDVYEEELRGEVPPSSNRVVTYKILRGDWFVISGNEGGRIFYHKFMLKDGVWKKLRIRYDASLDKELTPIIAHISKRFRNLESGPF